MRQYLRHLAALGAVCTVLLVPASHSYGADCGDGIVEGGEECDGGPLLFTDGDPAKGQCTTGSRCYFRFTCCKFNCQYVGTPGVPCQDGDSCSGPDTCDQIGVCRGGPSVADATPCDDGLFCNGIDTCNNGVCNTHTGDPCPATACNECQEATDSCFTPAGTTPCSGSVCVTGGTCNGAGVCDGGSLNPGPCDDGLFCNGPDTCNGGACTSHDGDPCPDSNDGDGDCMESCDEAADNCTAPDTELVTCDNGLFCDGATDVCNESGVCEGTGSVACDDGNSCTTETCDEGLDTCTNDGVNPDGTVCDDGDGCSLDDTCLAGVCTGAPRELDDLCPWTVVLRDPLKKDKIRTGRAVNIDGDLCGGIMKLGGRGIISSDVVAEYQFSTQLRLAPDAVIGGDIVSAGTGARAVPGSGILPYTASSVLAPGSTVAKNDLSGFYDLSGTHPLLDSCSAARDAYPANTGYLDSLVPTAALPALAIANETSAGITATVPGGLNVIDINGAVKIGKDSELVLNGAGNSDTVLVLRVAGSWDMKIRATLSLTNGLKASNLLIYVKGKQCKFGDVAFGSGTIVCSPGRVKARRLFAWIGAIFGDGRKLMIGDLSDIRYDPFTAF